MTPLRVRMKFILNCKSIMKEYSSKVFILFENFSTKIIQNLYNKDLNSFYIENNTITCKFTHGMAPMITAGAIASMAGLAPKLSSAIVGYGILISFITTAILFNIIHANLI